ncbi:MAG: hypothetical protein KBT11_12265 [Treponema sp.]|nr:hypothetical protein [Candidatus Treponema equifaecale]
MALLILSNTVIFAQNSKTNSSASVANRRTAIRYMQLAKQYASEKKWAEADSNAKIGLAYDDSIADLWYLRAASQLNNGEKKSEVLPLVLKSLNEAEWVDYNKDGARILYADILCTSHDYIKALNVLDAEPFIYSSDAEYIRSKAYYNLGTAESIEKARLKIDAARRVYPKDTRFAQLFYKYEYDLYLKKGTMEASAQKISDAFLASINNYKNSEPELELYAAFFVQDANRKIRLLKAFSAKGNRSPLYPIFALQAGLIEEHPALDYIYSFSDNTIELSVLEAFIKELKMEETQKEFAEYLNSYNGTLLIDTDGDLLPNMTVNYNRGRPAKVLYDENQDDEYEWISECDFGVPSSINLSKNNLQIFYEPWPYVQKAVYFIKEAGAYLNFDMIAETLAWTPFEVKANPVAREYIFQDFFVPQLNPNHEVTSKQMIQSALSYSMPSMEKKGAMISVSLLNGYSQTATYSVGENVYAVAQFKNGLPVSRTVDVDGDGLFETLEEYGFTTDLSQKFISRADEMQIMTNLFGSPATQTGIYIKSVKIDRNGDTIPDFIEEYLAGEGKISSWDLDSDGKWDVQYRKLPALDDGKLLEQACFYQPLTGNLVVVESEDKIPVSVTNGGKSVPIKKGYYDNFYWFEIQSPAEKEEIILRKVNQTAEQGVCIIVEDENSRYLAVKVEGMIFAEELPSASVKK